MDNSCILSKLYKPIQSPASHKPPLRFRQAVQLQGNQPLRLHKTGQFRQKQPLRFRKVGQLGQNGALRFGKAVAIHQNQPLMYAKKASHFCKALILLERETGLEPATLSLGS